MTRSSIDLSLLMSPVQYDSQQHGSVIVNGICSSTNLLVGNDICSSLDLSSLTVFAAASIYQRYRYSQQHRSISVTDIRSSIDPSALTVFAAASIYSSVTFFAAVFAAAVINNLAAVFAVVSIRQR